jgi:hypothetical protein
MEVMSKTKRQPDFIHSPHKFMAREFNIRLYRLITKNYSIPENKQYITLANIQDNSPTSEINQYVSAKFLKKYQFVGIDNEKKYITKNKKTHPEAKFIFGNWNSVILLEEFNPALIYLDSTYFADRKPALDALKNTMSICDEGTLIICNVMETNPRSGLGCFSTLDANVLISGLLEDQIPAAYMDWNKHKKNVSIDEISKSLMKVYSYNYKTTSRTKMRSFIFYKGVLPRESEILREFKEFDSWCSELERNVKK